MFQAPRSLVSICQGEPCKVVWKICQADLSGLQNSTRNPLPLRKLQRSTSMELRVALPLLTKTKPKNTTTAFQHSGGFFIGALVVVFPVIEMHLPISGGAQTAKGFSSSVIRVNAPWSRPRVILKWQPRAGTCQPCAKIHRLIAFQAAVQVHTPAPPSLCQACKHLTQQRPRTTYSGNDVRRLSNNQSSHNRCVSIGHG